MPLALLLAAFAVAQDPGPVMIARRDLASAFLRLDGTFASARARLDDETAGAANREMDLASLDFFGLRFASALTHMERARWLCLDDPPEWSVLEALASLRLDVGHGQELRIVSLFAVPSVASRRLAVPIRFQSAAKTSERVVTLEFDADGRAAFTGTLAEGEATSVAVIGPEGARYSPTRPPFSEAGAVRASLLEGMDALGPELAGAVRIFRSRVELIVRDPGPRSIEQLTEPRALARELRGERAQLVAGGNPYHLRSGDLWRTIAHGSQDLPVRLFVPGDRKNSEKLPLVVAFHGAGGDENFFHEAGGAGRLIELARVERFVVACPRTTDYTLSPRAFDALLDALARDCPVDPERVHVIGHSLGGMTIAGLLKVRSRRIASVVCISGARAFRAETPVLVLAGLQDPVVPHEGLAELVADARARELPVTIEAFEHEGHTLFVPRALERAIDWFGLARE
ncbi:MAG: alpha/beta fold hydrolase [bacterium]|nr:alpha/beta fold hydrolase [bacterium]